MRRYKNLNESVKIDVVELTNNHDDILVNDLRDTLEDIGATVSQEKKDGTIYMVVDDLTYDDIVNELSPLIYDIDDYIVDTDLTEHYDYPDYDEDDEDDYPDYDEDDEDEDDYDDYDYDDYDEERYSSNNDNWDPTDDLDDEDWEDYNDEFECDGNNCFDDEDEEFNNTEDYDEDDKLNDDVDVDECYESYKPKFTSKRKGCCPPRKARKVNLSEALKQNKNKFSIRDVVRSAKNEALNESTIKHAMKKMKNLKKDKLNEAIHNIGTAKYNLIMEAINAKRPVLYTKKTINGKNISEYSSKELFELLKEAKKQYLSLKQMLNESNDKTLNEKIENKKRLMEVLDDELTYRLTFKNKMNESDEENMFKELPMGPEVSSTDDEEKDEKADDSKADETSDKEEKNDDSKADETSDKEEKTDDAASENDEEVELSRVVITLDTQEAADELKQDLVDAGVPEDAITIGDDEEESEEDSEEATDEESADEEKSEEASEESNESTHYNNFKKLLEADEDEESADEEGTEETSDEEASEDEAEEDNEEASEDEEITLVLTDTDYIHTLADVLNDKYGITKEEFEEMIGGEIVDSDDEEADDEDNSENEESKDDEESKDEEKSSNGDDAIDAMSPEEIDKLFGDN